MQLNDIKITLSKRKTIALHVHEDGNVELRAPVGVDRLILEEMVAQKSDWIKQKKDSLNRRFNHLNRKQINWLNGDEIPFGNKILVIEYCYNKKSKIFLEDNRLIIFAPEQVPEKIKVMVFNWLKKTAQLRFPERVAFWKQKMYSNNQQLIKVQPRKMCSRWGSCSKDKSIRLNTLLLMLPENLMDYVIVHELCHWKVFNHSAKFYQLLESILPHWKSLEKQLRDHQYLLLEVRK